MGFVTRGRDSPGFSRIASGDRGVIVVYVRAGGRASLCVSLLLTFKDRSEGVSVVCMRFYEDFQM